MKTLAKDFMVREKKWGSGGDLTLDMNTNEQGLQGNLADLPRVVTLNNFAISILIMIKGIQHDLNGTMLIQKTKNIAYLDAVQIKNLNPKFQTACIVFSFKFIQKDE